MITTAPKANPRAFQTAGPVRAPRLLSIEPLHGWASLRLRELWEYRELLYFLTWRDIKVRYKQTVLGGAWALIQPIFTMLVFSVFFGRLAKVPSEGIPYSLFALAALVPWTFFANATTEAAGSLVANSSLVTKVYFPRLAIPVSAALAGLVDFALGFVLLLAFTMFRGAIPSGRVILLPVFFLLALITALGVGLWLSALNAKYRDIRYTLPFLMQFWMLATPIAYPSGLLSEPWRTIYGLNPMAGVVEGFRWSLLNGSERPGAMLIVSFATSLTVLISGALYFRRMEQTFADIV
jgi:lipopolysaccharide transport system permease protein